MTRAEHIARHQLLHACLDEIIADYITHECAYPSRRMPSNITLLELMEWSARQTRDPAGATDDEPAARV